MRRVLPRVSSRQRGGAPKYGALDYELSDRQHERGGGAVFDPPLSERIFLTSSMRPPGVGAIVKGATKMVVNSKSCQTSTFDVLYKKNVKSAISGVRLCWELEEPKGPKGQDLSGQAMRVVHLRST